MSGVLAASPTWAVLGAHRRGGGIGLIILLVVVVVGVAWFVQRRRDRRPLEEPTPAPRTGQPSVEAVGGGVTALAASSPVVSSGARATASAVVTRRATELPAGHYNILDLLGSEWTKLRTVRSTVWSYALTVGIGIGVSALATAETRAHWTSTSAVGFDPVSLSLIGVFFGQLVIGVLGVLVVSAEYTTGTIRATFSAAPRRPLVLAAKVAVFAGATLVVAEVLTFSAFLLGQSLLTSPATHATLSSPQALRSVFETGIYLVVIGLFAMSLATLIRHTAGAISTFVGILLVLPTIFQALPSSIYDSLARFLPSRIGGVIISRNFANSNVQTFGPWVGLAVLAGYVAVLLAVGGYLQVRRDA
jgi:ABC-2 type transport system permease protein